jgi:type IV secretory pathway TrbD component
MSEENDPDDGYEIDMYSDTPTLLGAERGPMMLVIAVSGTIVAMFHNAPNPWWCFIGGPVFFAVGYALCLYAYHLDPQMSLSLPRFLKYKKFIPAQDGLGVTESARQRLKGYLLRERRAR